MCGAALHPRRRAALGRIVLGPGVRDSRGRHRRRRPGTVFTTESDGGAATWIALERRDDGVSYARVAPGRIAGTITVHCSQTVQDETRVTVRYDVTSLDPEGVDFVHQLDADYDAFQQEWRREILASLDSERSSEARIG
jgi:hypothetical protein